MKDFSDIVLRSGIQSLIYESDVAFKKSLINTLSFKLNEAIKDVKQSFASSLFHKETKTNATPEIEYFINFVENYDSKTNNLLKLKNHSSINIKDHELEILKEMFDCLNIKNRQLMVEELLKNENGIKKQITFYKKAKGSIK
jgi:hypothetical protein